MVWGGGEILYLECQTLDTYPELKASYRVGDVFSNFSLSSLLPPRGPHCVNFTALMLPPQLHVEGQCTKICSQPVACSQ